MSAIYRGYILSRKPCANSPCALEEAENGQKLKTAHFPPRLKLENSLGQAMLLLNTDMKNVGQRFHIINETRLFV